LADEDLRRSIVHATRRFEPAIEFSTVVQLGFARASDREILAFAWENHWLVVSHDVNTMKVEAEARVRDARGLAGLFLVPQRHPTRVVAESLLLIGSASQREEWRDRIVYLPL
jgi:hypothetical protein